MTNKMKIKFLFNALLILNCVRAKGTTRIISFVNYSRNKFLQSNMEASDKIQESATLLDLFKTPRLARNTILLVAFWQV